MRERSTWFLFSASVLLALVLIVAPLPFNAPNWVGYLRPDWLLLVWFFWIVVKVQHCTLLLAFIIGLLADVLVSQPLGLNAFLMISLTFIGSQALRVIQRNVGLNATLALFVLCFAFTLVESLVLKLAYDVEIEVINTVVSPIMTLLFWLPFIPFLTSKISQFNEELD